MTRHAASFRLSLLASAGAASLACALGAAPAAAQTAGVGFQGTMTPVSGSVTMTSPAANTDQLAVGAGLNIVDWAPYDTTGTGTIDFLPVGSTGIFTNAAGVASYIIVNRVVPTDPSRGIALNGTIQALLNGKQGGEVWFYSPGGILVGSTAVIDVGSLLLTTALPTGFTFVGPDLVAASFAASADSRAGVTIQPGASITALGANAYVALLGPRITQGGTVNVDGSATYAAGEQIDLTINGNLFDVSVPVGSYVDPAIPGDGQTLTHTGTTTGPASVDFSDPQHITMVAVAKNQAVTMLVQGNVGYAPADVASFAPNGDILLSAGFNTFAGCCVASPASSIPSNISISKASFSSRVDAAATGNVTASAAAGTSVQFDQGLSFRAFGNAELLADGGTIGVDGFAQLNASHSPSFDGSPNAIAGTARIRASAGGTVDVSGDIDLNATGFGRSDFDELPGEDGIGEDGRGGTASLLADGGTITVGASAFLTANGNGGFGSDQGGHGFGGAASADAINGGSISIGEGLELTASGSGAGAGNIGAGNGTGGTARIATNNGGISAGFDITVLASGSPGFSFAGVTPGVGMGGLAQAIARNGGAGIVTPGTLTVSAPGAPSFGRDFAFANQDVVLFSRAGVVGGPGIGGTAEVILDGAPLAVAALSILAQGNGGDGSSGQDGSLGQGGTARLEFRSGTYALSDVTIDASGAGGDGGRATETLAAGTGGTGTGGLATVVSTGGTGTISDLSITSSGYGGLGGAGYAFDMLTAVAPRPGGGGGTGQGGTTLIETQAGSISITNLLADADGLGGMGGDGGDGGEVDSADGGDGGDGTGGTAVLRSSGGTLTLADVGGRFGNFSARGRGGDGGFGGSSFVAVPGAGGDGGDGRGGTVQAVSTAGALTTGVLFLDAQSQGGFGGLPGSSDSANTNINGLGGSGYGGRPQLSNTGGTQTHTAAILLGSGATPTAFPGGTAFAGVASITKGPSGTLTTGTLSVNVVGADAGIGPAFVFTADQGTVQVTNNVAIDASTGASFTGTGTGSLAAGNVVNVNSNGTISLAQSPAGGATPLISGRILNLTATGAPIVGPTAFVLARDDATLTGTTISIGKVSAGDDIRFITDSLIAGTLITTRAGADNEGDGSNAVVSIIGNIQVDNSNVADALTLTSTGGSVTSTGSLNAGNIVISGATGVSLNIANAPNTVDVTSGGALAFASGGTGIGNVTLTAAGPATLGTLSAGTDLIVNAGTGITITSANAGNDVRLSSTSGGITAGQIGTGGTGPDSEGDGSTAVVSAPGLVSVTNASVFGRLALTSTGAAVTSTGNLAAGSIAINGATGVALNIANSPNTIDVTSGGALAFASGGTGGGNVTLTAAGAATLGSLSAGTDFIVSAAGITLAGIGANRDIRLTSSAGITGGDAIALRDLTASAVGAITLGTAQAGDDVRLISSGGGVTVASLVTTGAGADTEADGSDAVIAIAGPISVANASVAGGLTLTSTANGIASTGTLMAGSIAINGATGVALNAANATTTLAVTTGGALALASGSSGGNTALSATGGATLGTITAGSDLVVNAAGITLASLTAARDVTLTSSAGITGGGAIALRDLTASAVGAIILGAARAGDDVLLTSSGGGVTVANLVTTGAGADTEADGSNAVIAIAGPISVANASVAGGLTLTSTANGIASTGTLVAGSIAINGATGVALNAANSVGATAIASSGGPVSSTGTLAASTTLGVNAGGAITLAGSTSGGVTSLTAGGAVSDASIAAGGGVTASGTAVTLTAPGALRVNAATASAGNVALTAGGALNLAGPVAASGALSARSTGLLTVGSSLAATDIALTSPDIAVGATAAIGTAATQTVTFNAIGSAGTVTLGGAVQGPGYTLGAAELARVQTRDLVFRVGSGASEGLSLSAGPNDLLIDSFALSATAAGRLAGEALVTGSARIEAQDIDVVGQVDYRRVTTTNLLSIAAAGDFHADTSGAGIRLLDGTGALGGILSVDGARVTVASQAAANEIAGASIAEKDRILGRNDGAVSDPGYLQAGTIRLAADLGIYVQNSGQSFGPPPARRGVTAGTGGITLQTSGSDTEIVINGRQQTATGFATGLQLIPLVRIVNSTGGAGQYAFGSTINGCFISGAGCGVYTDSDPPIQDLIDRLTDPDGDGDSNDADDDGAIGGPGDPAFDRGLVSFASDQDSDGLPDFGVIDEPVTGAGNEELWTCRDDNPEAAADESKPDQCQ